MAKRYCDMCDALVKGAACPACGMPTRKVASAPQPTDCPKCAERAATFDRILNGAVPEGYQPVSFAALCDSIDSKQLEETVYNLLIWHMRRVDALEHQLRASAPQPEDTTSTGDKAEECHQARHWIDRGQPNCRCGELIRAFAEEPASAPGEELLKLRTASESVGWLNSVGPLSVSPSVPASAPQPEPKDDRALVDEARHQLAEGLFGKPHAKAYVWIETLASALAASIQRAIAPAPQEEQP